MLVEGGGRCAVHCSLICLMKEDTTASRKKQKVKELVTRWFYINVEVWSRGLGLVGSMRKGSGSGSGSKQPRWERVDN